MIIDELKLLEHVSDLSSDEPSNRIELEETGEEDCRIACCDKGAVQKPGGSRNSVGQVDQKQQGPDVEEGQDAMTIGGSREDSECQNSRSRENPSQRPSEQRNRQGRGRCKEIWYRDSKDRLEFLLSLGQLAWGERIHLEEVVDESDAVRSPGSCKCRRLSLVVEHGRPTRVREERQARCF